MEKKRKGVAEFRFYEKPVKEPVLALMGPGWVRDYGDNLGHMHFHNMVEIGFCDWGDGGIALGNRQFDYTGGYFTFIPHNYLHTTSSVELSKWSYLFFDVEELLKDRYRDNPEMVRELLYCVGQGAFLFGAGEERHLGELINMVLAQMEMKREYYVETISSLLLAIVLQIAALNETANERKDAGAKKKGVKKATGSKILPALEYISRHSREDIRVSALAECCHLSEVHFRRIFMQDMNMAPVEYINLSRVQAACDLMRRGNSNMKEVAVKVGYQTMSTFNRNFRQIVGSSPYQWKKQMDAQSGNLADYHIRAKKGW